MATSTGHRPLSPDDLKSYHERGYFLYRGQVFEAAQLAELDAIFREQREKEREKRGDEFDTPHFQDKRLLEFLLAPALLDLVECVVGPNIVLWSSHFICKDPLIGRATPWHEDSSYWMGRLSRYDKIVTVWLALDDVDRENGCMQVIPGSHIDGGFSSYKGVDESTNTFPTEISDIDVSDAVAFELRRGQCSLHDGRIRHGAHANTSSRRRLGYTMRYLSADVDVFPEQNVGHRLWLARGHAAPSDLFQTQ
jgi:ectoine hydroxylase-related dioxygenase (phytanoyl-CoA dioxygenase family)